MDKSIVCRSTWPSQFRPLLKRFPVPFWPITQSFWPFHLATSSYMVCSFSDVYNLEPNSQAGFHGHNSSWDFVVIALLACFCAIHKHGYKMLFSLSDIVQDTPCPPVGFSILKAGLSKSVLLSVYASGTPTDNVHNPSQGIYLYPTSGVIIWGRLDVCLKLIMVI